MPQFYVERDAYIDCLFENFANLDIGSGTAEAQQIVVKASHSLIKKALQACQAQREVVRSFLSPERLDWLVNDIDDKATSRMFFLIRDFKN